jgi:hypothetical protein
MVDNMSNIVEDFYKVKAANPYRWLENDDSQRRFN